MSKTLRTTNYTNVETGEYKEKKDWIDVLMDEEGYLFWNKKAGVKLFLDIPLPEGFTWAEKGMIGELQRYILRDNQLLVYRSNGKIKPLLTKELCRILGIKDRQCRNIVSKLKKSSIIKEVSYGSVKYFAFNPIYAFKGKRLSLSTFIMFQEELQKVLPKWVTAEFLREVQDLKPDIKVVK